MTLPLAERFHSLQGEGYWLGAQMHFVRLAGCPVGKKATLAFHEGDGPDSDKHFPIYPSKCQTWDGRFFDCDTDFSVKEYMSVDEIIEDTWEEHICLTGGEPLIHQLTLIARGLFMKAFEKKIMIHVETSGTIMLHGNLFHDNRVWITVSPKFDVLPQMIVRADELKLLVDDEFDVGKIPLEWQVKDNFFLSPINGEHSIDTKNRDKTLAALKTNKHWRYTPQLHKYLGLQ